MERNGGALFPGKNTGNRRLQLPDPPSGVDSGKQPGNQMEAWRPLLKGNVDLPEISELAGKYRKTPAQILLRWEIQSGYIVIPKSVHQERIFENADIFDFELDETDMSQLSSMNTGKHSSHDPESYDF